MAAAGAASGGEEVNTMDAPRYEVLEHTADLRMAFHGADLSSLLQCAAHGLFREMAGCDLPPATTAPMEVHLEYAEPDLLLRAWLAELLYLFETERVLFTAWAVSIGDGGALHGAATGVPLATMPGQLHTEVKAVTYHGLSVTETTGGLRAEVIFDL